MDDWTIEASVPTAPLRAGQRTVLSIGVTNGTVIGSFVGLACDVRSLGEPVDPRWKVSVGDGLTVAAGGTERFVVAVTPPPETSRGAFELQISALDLGSPPRVLASAIGAIDVENDENGIEAPSSWLIELAGNAPLPGDGEQSLVEFNIAGTPGSQVRIEVEAVEPAMPAGKFPTRFEVSASELTLPPTGLDRLSVTVTIGTSPSEFEVTLVEVSTGRVVARSGPVVPAASDPRTPGEFI